MAEEIEIVNVGGDGVASEATLKSLADAIKKLAMSTGKDPRAEEAKLIKTANEARKSGIEVIKDQNDAMEDLTTSTERANRQMNSMNRGMGNLVLNGLGAVLGSAVNLGKELAFGGERMTDFARHLPGIGQHLAVLTQFVDDNIDSFRQLANVGIDFGESIFEVRRQAAISGVSLDAFQQAIANNSESLARFGGTAQTGARRFAQISGIIQSNLGPSFDRLGITMEQSADLTASYLAMQTRTGRAQTMTQAQLSAGAAEYILQLDKLSKITGKSREQLASEMEASITPGVNILMRNMEDGGAAFRGITQLLGTESQELSDAFATLVERNGVPVMGTLSAGLAFLNGDIRDLAQRVKEGTATEEESEEVLRATIKAAQDYADAQGDQLAILARQGDPRALAVSQLLGLGETVSAMDEAAAEQADAIGDSSRGILSFERIVAEMRNNVNNELVEQGIFQGLQDVLSGALGTGLTEAFKSPLVLGAIAGAFGGITLAGLGRRALGGLLGGDDDSGGGGRGRGRGGGRGMLGGMLGGIGRGAGAGLLGIGTGLAAVGKMGHWVVLGGAALGTAIGLIAAGIGVSILMIGKSLPVMAEGLMPFTELDGEKLHSAGDGLKSLAGGIAAFGVGSFAAAIGNLNANAINSLNEFFGGSTMFDKIEEFSALNIDSAKMTTNAEAIAAFGNAMSSLSGLDDAAFANMLSNLFNGISKVFGGNTLYPWDNVKLFEAETFDKAKIQTNAEAMAAFGTALSNLPEITTSRVGGIFGAIAEVFAGEIVYPWDKVKEFGKEDLDPSGFVVKNASAIAGFASAMNSFQTTGEIDTQRAGGLFGLVAYAFAGSTQFPWDKVREFGAVELDPNGNIMANAEAMTNFSNGLAGFRDADISSVVIPNISDLTTGIGDLNNAFDAEKIDNYEDALWNLKDTISDLNDEIRENNSLAASTIDNAAAARGGGDGGSGSNRALIQLLTDLNTTMTNIKDELDDQGDTQDRTLRAVRALGNGL